MVLKYSHSAYEKIPLLSTIFRKLITLFVLSVVASRINTSPPIRALLERAKILLVEQRVQLDQVQRGQERYTVFWCYRIEVLARVLLSNCNNVPYGPSFR